VGRGTVDVHPLPEQPATITVRPRRVQELLGLGLARAEMTGALKALGASVSSAAGGALAVTPPSYRNDLKREIDLVEEIARVVGYHRIPATLPAIRIVAGEVPARWRWERELKRVLIAAGFYEAISVSFVSSRSNALFPGI